MTENDQYKEAVRRISGISQTLEPALDLTDLEHIYGLPDEIAALSHLEQIDLRGTTIGKIEAIKGMSSICVLDVACTNVTDLDTIATLTNLEWLSIAETSVDDILPLVGLRKLSALSVRKTRVRDLRPLLELRGLSLDPEPAIWFHGTPATANDPLLAELSLIEDDTRRTTDTLAYLRTLPPYPEPLPWLSGETARQKNGRSASSKAQIAQTQIAFLLEHAALTNVHAGTTASQIRLALRDVPAAEGTNRLPEALETAGHIADILDRLSTASLDPAADNREAELTARLAELEAELAALTQALQDAEQKAAAAEALAKSSVFVEEYKTMSGGELAKFQFFLAKTGTLTGVIYLLGQTHPLIQALLKVL